MIALISFLVTVVFSIIVVRIGTVALRMTGLSREVAAFQAQSAFCGVGFTTSESEALVSHPVRRRILRILMLFGSAGLTSAVATLILTFVGQSAREAGVRCGLIAIGLAILYLFAYSRWADRIMSRIIEKLLRRYTRLGAYDYEQLFGLSKGFAISEFKVHKENWLAGRSLRELELNREGILIIGLYRRVNNEERYIGAPQGDTVIKEGDTVICYGHEEAIIALSHRAKGKEGERERLKAVEKEQRLEKIRQMQGGFD
ncbi:potassium transporter TrkA [Candidatus Aerophobetes bacterium]|uniref:Potassium transporter TrkA n=1 Tax=Aerophobetes bacterium TaxID=2030807 RepID=A0A497E4X4_UNCAE|nr:MAG: potassium transporter TrkA [Candidatus Aerophobetes bacterium]